jgi:hypothetical protein
MQQVLFQERTFRVRKGTKNLPEERCILEMPMGLIDQAESRLHEIRLVSPATANELKGLFNEAANKSSKYIAWIEYEILKAQKQYDLDRATVILDKAPVEAVKLKEHGIKMNEDLREALISRDEDCQYALDILNALKAAKALLESNYWSFIRAFNSADHVSQQKTFTPTPNFGGTIGQTYNVPQANFLGHKETGENNG